MRTTTMRELSMPCLFLAAALAARTAAAGVRLAGLGDMEKPTKDEAIPASPHFWDAAGRTLKLHGGRNEVVAGQLVLTADENTRDVSVAVGDLRSAGGEIIPADPDIGLFLELYQYVENGGYGWGPPSKVLPWKKWYPEVLAPFRDPYAPDRKAVGAPFEIAVADGPNQGIWIDVYIPKEARPGVYEAPITVTIGGKPAIAATLALTVHAFTLPDEFHVDGYGEMYGRAYHFHGAEYGSAGVERWWQVAKRYHQMAHQHRFVITEREGAGPGLARLDDYDKTYGAVLDGTLFTPAQGYVGPGAGTGVAFWRAPFAQAYDGRVPDFTPEQLKRYADDARAFWEHVVARRWNDKRFFAYIIDEAGCDARSLANERKLQEALDAGAGPGHVRLMWTSHTDPETLAADPATDKRGVIHWWSANAGGCNPAFLRPQIEQGDIVWFYHHGGAACGVHCVNASGIELRTWGDICWRYKIHGSFWWAMDYGSPDTPLTRPVYKDGDDRWGNGVLFYPGARLPDVGLPAIDGPLSCLRMKAYRRGLQDYEYCRLLKQAGKEKVADDLIRAVIPKALVEAGRKMTRTEAEADARREAAGGERAGGDDGTPFWSRDVNVWYQMRKDLAKALVTR